MADEPRVPPQNGSAGRHRDVRPEALRHPAQPARHRSFESLLQRLDAAGTGEPAVDGAALRLDGPAPQADGAPHAGDAMPYAPAPLFGATLGTQASVPASAGRTAFVPLLGAAAVRCTRPAPGSALAPDARPASDPEAQEAAWELVREVTESLHVAPQRQAQHGAVHLVLKGRLLAGTEVTLLRQGQRLEVQIMAGTADGHRILRQQVQALQEALAGGAAGCHVSVSLCGKT